MGTLYLVCNVLRRPYHDFKSATALRTLKSSRHLFEMYVCRLVNPLVSPSAQSLYRCGITTTYARCITERCNLTITMMVTMTMLMTVRRTKTMWMVMTIKLQSSVPFRISIYDKKVCSLLHATPKRGTNLTMGKLNSGHFMFYATAFFRRDELSKSI